jgi:hypothetical protein
MFNFQTGAMFISFGGNVATTPGSKLDQELSTIETPNLVASRYFKPRLQPGEYFTIPVGAELTYDDGVTWLATGNYLWNGVDALPIGSAYREDGVNWLKESGIQIYEESMGA